MWYDEEGWNLDVCSAIKRIRYILRERFDMEHGNISGNVSKT